MCKLGVSYCSVDPGLILLALALQQAAVAFPSVECGKVLLEFGADIESENARGETPLIRACTFNKHTAFTKFLLEKGANVNMQTLVRVM